MKRLVICLFAVYFLLGFSATVSTADEGQKTTDKGIGAAIADDAREVKKELDKTVEATKDAIVRDVKEMKEDIPKGLKEAKDSAIQQSKEIKDGATKELKEIRDNMANPSIKSKSESN